ncbi:MAG: molybdopterin-dependent oxidoreductase [bacterium]|jgi:anaerobic selenocysteine-containing dehydrogenase
MTENLASGALKIAVADPRFSKLASKAWKWLPVHPGTDGAMAMAFIRWMLDNNRFDAKFLACANKAAAAAAGENSWTNSTWLVEIKDGKPGKFVRAADIGLCAPEIRKNKDGKEYEEKFIVVYVNGQPKAVDPNSTEEPVVGDLFVDATLPNGTHAKSALQVLRDSANVRSFEEWAALTGVKAADLEEVARELTSYGKQAAVDIHRGVAQHTNGFYNVLAWMTVNMLLGNFDAKGGMVTQSTYDTMGKAKLFDLNAHPGAIKGFGISCIRHDIAYEKTSIFSGYPAKRNWYPLASDIYEEIIPSIGDAYPYPVKAVFMYMGAPTYALPAGHTNIEILCDTTKVPLFVCNDILIGPTSMYADYIFPDNSYLERWEFHGSHPNIAQKVQPVRQPVIAPLVEECTVYGQKMPINFEAMLFGIAERLGLPGFGDNAFGDGLDLKHQDDFYLRGVANLAFGEAEDGSKAVADADAKELDLFVRSRAHLTSSVFDEARWKGIVGESLWPKVVYVLNRGGRFQEYEKGYKDMRVGNPYGALLNLYQEKTAGTVYSGTGEKCSGVATYIPVRDYLGREPDAYRDGWDLHLVTHRVINMTKSRTIVDYWLTDILPSNGILISPEDAKRLGLKDGDAVKVASATNPEGDWRLGNGKRKPMAGKVIVTRTVKPGVVSFALGYGHWASGSQEFTIDGHKITSEVRRGEGIHANAAMWTDPTIKNTCMFDPVGGSVSFYDTRVRLVKA